MEALYRFAPLQKVTRYELVDLDWGKNSLLNTYKRQNCLEAEELQFPGVQISDGRQLVQVIGLQLPRGLV